MQAAILPSETLLTSQMKALQNLCFSARVDYWGYEVCTSQRVRQYHIGKEMNIDHSLGTRMSGEDEWRTYDSWRAYTQHFIGGTGGREAEVRYFCPESWEAKDGITSVQEPSPLRYVIEVRLQLLCPMGRSPPRLDTLQLRLSPILASLAVIVFTLWNAKRMYDVRASPAVEERLGMEFPEVPMPKPEPTPDLERLGECVICLEPIQRSAVGSCAHHFCVGEMVVCSRVRPSERLSLFYE